ncbi:uncharacterized protein PV07_11970 [Cladophialophora immunda]|uniref:Uncharacterized protein n=1 Tax=Cladophialophora immunda TaxID=569365 RepID=A0A0D2AFY3_9EURO|nr:uncharacterized protein PV07_11970 [Cladophialophora immunda]KIW23797.1 hypothetical protein PV07_11970 [Cladophialophora immunda]
MDNLYFVLPYPLHGNVVSSLMCRVVANPLNPGRKFIPNLDEPSPLVLSEVLPNLLPDPIAVEPTASMTSGMNTTLKARLEQLFSYTNKTNTTQSFELKAQIQRYTLTQNDWKFRKLLENDRFAQEVTQLVRENGGKAYMVSAFLTCEESTWMRSTKDRSSHSGQAKFGTTDGNATKVEASGAVVKNAGHRREGEITDKLVFAIAYDVIGTEWYFEWNAKWFPQLKTKIVLKSELRADWHQLSMGKEEEEEEVLDDGDEGDDKKRVSAANLILAGMSKEAYDLLQTSNPDGEAKDSEHGP